MKVKEMEPWNVICPKCNCKTTTRIEMTFFKKTVKCYNCGNKIFSYNLRYAIIGDIIEFIRRLLNEK